MTDKLLDRVINWYPYVSYSPPLTACALLILGIWLTSWTLVSVGAASMVYQIWGYAYKRQKTVVTIEPPTTCDQK